MPCEGPTHVGVAAGDVCETFAETFAYVSSAAGGEQVVVSAVAADTVAEGAEPLAETFAEVSSAAVGEEWADSADAADTVVDGPNLPSCQGPNQSSCEAPNQSSCEGPHLTGVAAGKVCETFAETFAVVPSAVVGEVLEVRVVVVHCSGRFGDG